MLILFDKITMDEDLERANFILLLQVTADLSHTTSLLNQSGTSQGAYHKTSLAVATLVAPLPA